MKQITCAFAGHRPKSFPWRYCEADERCVKLKTALSVQIRALIRAGITVFLSGMAEGVDIWAAEMILALREKNPALKLHCVLPCEGQADRWSVLSQERYYLVLRQADAVTYVSRDYHKDCMLERNRWLVDHSAVLLAVYNGSLYGGTAAAIRYARKQRHEMIILDPLTLEVSGEGSLCGWDSGCS